MSSFVEEPSSFEARAAARAAEISRIQSNLQKPPPPQEADQNLRVITLHNLSAGLWAIESAEMTARQRHEQHVAKRRLGALYSAFGARRRFEARTRRLEDALDTCKQKKVRLEAQITDARTRLAAIVLQNEQRTAMMHDYRAALLELDAIYEWICRDGSEPPAAESGAKKKVETLESSIESLQWELDLYPGLIAALQDAQKALSTAVPRFKNLLVASQCRIVGDSRGSTELEECDMRYIVHAVCVAEARLSQTRSTGDDLEVGTIDLGVGDTGKSNAFVRMSSDKPFRVKMELACHRMETALVEIQQRIEKEESARDALVMKQARDESELKFAKDRLRDLRVNRVREAVAKANATQR